MEINVPRRFRMIRELECGEKGVENGAICYGPADLEDKDFKLWRATILGPEKTVYEDKIYELLITCGENYPNEQPRIKFSSHISVSYADQNGLVLLSKVPGLIPWSKKYYLRDILIALRKEMLCVYNRKRIQPISD